MKIRTVKDGFYYEQPNGKLKPNRAKFTRAAKELQRLGYNVTYKANDKRTFRQRGIIHKLYTAKAAYINFTEPPGRKSRKAAGIEYNFKFQKLTAKERRIAKASGLFSSKQFAPAGVWIEKPANVPAAHYHVRFEGKADVYIRGGDRRDVNVKIEAREMVRDPHKAVESAIKRATKRGEKPRAISLMVNGWSSRHQSASLNAFFYYLDNTLLPEWISKNEDRHDDEDEMFEEFTDIFHLKLLMGKNGKKRRTK